MRSWRWLGAALVVVVTMTACGAQTAGERTLERCAEGPDGNDPTAGVAANVGLLLETDTVLSGERFGFSWIGTEGREVVTGDEWIVQCWDGDHWTNAWFMIDVYESFGGAEAVLIEEGIGGTDDGWQPLPGVIIVPDPAPAGFYRLFETVAVDGALLMVEARFEIADVEGTP